jgi:hypothetical protein
MDRTRSKRFIFYRRRRFLFSLIDMDALFSRGDADSPDAGHQLAAAPHTGTPLWCCDGASYNCMQRRRTVDAIRVSKTNTPTSMMD